MGMPPFYCSWEYILIYHFLIYWIAIYFECCSFCVTLRIFSERIYGWADCGGVPVSSWQLQCCLCMCISVLVRHTYKDNEKHKKEQSKLMPVLPNNVCSRSLAICRMFHRRFPYFFLTIVCSFLYTLYACASFIRTFVIKCEIVIHEFGFLIYIYTTPLYLIKQFVEFVLI